MFHKVRLKCIVVIKIFKKNFIKQKRKNILFLELAVGRHAIDCTSTYRATTSKTYRICFKR